MEPQRTGVIVNVSSTAGLAGQAGLGGYASAKAALAHLTRTAAVEAASDGVRVNSLCPGVIATKGTLSAFSDAARQAAMTRQIPIARFGFARGGGPRRALPGERRRKLHHRRDPFW